MTKYNKHVIVIWGFFLIFYSSVKAQNIYIKPNISILTPLLKNNIPNYTQIPFGDESIYDYRTDDYKAAKIANGYCLGISIGKTLKNDISVEIDLNHTIYEFTSHYEDIFDEITSNWDIRSTNLAPGFLYGQSWNKLSLFAKIGGTIGYSNLTINKDPYTHDVIPVPANKLESNPFISYGYFIGFDCNYKVGKKVHLSVNCMIDNSFFKPKQAKDRYDDNIYFVEDYIDYTPTQDNTKILSQTLKLTALKIEIGLKYIFGKTLESK